MPTVVASNSGRIAPSTGLTIIHTVPAGTNRMLVVLLDCSAAMTVSATYGGVPLTVSSDVAGGFHLYVFTLANPPVGTANVALTSGTSGTLAACVMTLTDCTYVGPLNTVIDTVTATPSITVSSVTGELVLDICATALAGVTFTVGAGQTSILEQDGLSGAAGRIAVSSEPGAASVTMSWTLSSSTNSTIGALTAYQTAPATAEGRVSQLPVEVAIQSDAPVTLQVSQLPLEVAILSPLDVRVTQDVVELLSQPIPDIRVTQDVVELLSSSSAIVTSSEQIQFQIICP